MRGRAAALGLALAMPAMVSTRSSAASPQAAPGYDPQSEIAISGFVTEVRLVGLAGERTHRWVRVRTPKDTFDVDIGPEWFLKEHGLVVAKGDLIDVVGSRLARGPEDDFVVARQVKRGKQRITLRDKRGFAVWPDRSGVISPVRGSPRTRAAARVRTAR
jgi:hypothetical protein